MTISAGSGISTHVNISEAIEEAWAQIQKTLKGDPSVVIAYVGVAHERQSTLNSLRELVGPSVPVIGGSSQGASIGGEALEQPRFLALAAISGVTVTTASVDDISKDSAASGAELAAALGAPPEGPHATVLFYDPLGGVNAQALVDSLADGGYPHVYGAATGQPWGKFVGTYQFAADRVTEKGATVARIDGVEVIAELTHGAESLGLELEVTKSEGNIVYELNGRPALDVWCEQLGVEPEADVENSANWALGMTMPAGTNYEGLITRAPFSLDNEARTLVFQAPVPVGASVQVCIRTQDAVYDRALDMSKRLKNALTAADPVLALGFECGARPSPFLGAEKAKEEVCAMQQTIGVDTPWLGTYAWGEIAPVGDRTYFHNFTFPLAVLVRPNA